MSLNTSFYSCVFLLLHTLATIIRNIFRCFDNNLITASTKCKVNGDEKGAQIVLKVVDDEKEPVMLIAPEDHWGKVNVAKLVSDLPGENAKKKFIVPRARKMILRALSLLCGGGSSSFRGNLVSVTTLREMDSAQEQIAIDMVNRYIPYLEKLGVTRKEMTTYVEACEEGWAPAPTNSVQKQIWDEIHALPTAPLKIKPETKKVEK